MKFLCVPCDSPMTLQTMGPPDRGSLSVVYACPECGYEIAMLTNAYETQVVQSLGVRIGPRVRAEGVPAPQGAGEAMSGAGCPFAGMIAGSSDAPGVPALDAATLPLRWTPAAEARLTNIPEFVRPMARTGIERFAREQGAVEIDEPLLDAAREYFGM